MVTLVLTEVARLSALALPITNGAKGITTIPLPGRDLASSASRSSRTSPRSPSPRLAFYFVAVTLMVLCFAGALPAGQFAHRPPVPVAAAERGARLLDRRQRRRVCACIAYAISSFLGGVGGAMFVAISQSIYPSSFTVTDSRELHAELLPRRPRLRLRPDARHARALFRLGPPVPDRRIPAADLFDAADRADAGPAERPPQPRLRRAGSRAEPWPSCSKSSGLTKRFGGLVAVNDVSFDVARGEILSVIGPNGAGKSTLFKLIASFLRPTSGEVRFKGERISDLAPHIVARKGVVRTFQETTIFKGMSVRDNVIIAHHLRSQASLLGFFLGTGLAAARRGRLRPSRPTRSSSFLGLGAARRRARQQPAAGPSARARHRHRARHQPDDPAARRAVRRHEPRRDDARGGDGARGCATAASPCCWSSTTCRP